MLYIDSFGTSLVIDRKTSCILLVDDRNEVAKTVSSIMLDTFVLQFNENLLKPYREVAETYPDATIVYHRGLNFTVADESVSRSLKPSKNRALILRAAVLLLFEQAVIAGAACDNISSLSSHDFNLYNQYPDQYVKEFAAATKMNIDEAECHLSFLHDSLLSLHFRKMQLLWKYLRTLDEVYTMSDFQAWKDSVLKETVVLGCV
jgi:hypothetical protein